MPEVVLDAVVKKVRVVKSDSGWGFCDVSQRGEADLVKVVGIVGSVKTGQDVQVTGAWNDHPRFGRQFKAAAIVVVKPTTLDGMRRHLAQCDVAGIGPAMASRIVAKFGDATWDVIEKEPDRLTEVQGLRPEVAQSLHAYVVTNRTSAEFAALMRRAGVGERTAASIYKFYRDKDRDPMRVVLSDPYQIADDVPRVGFETADRIGQIIGIAFDSPFRVRAGIRHAITQASGTQGHCYLPIEELCNASASVLKVPPSKCLEVLEIAVTTDPAERGPHSLVLDDDVDSVYVNVMLEAERTIARRLAILLDGQSRVTEATVESVLPQFQQAMTEELRFKKKIPEGKHFKYEARQVEAIRQVAKSKVSIITGGPGTGKTTILRGILEILRAVGVPAHLCAPTGRAAMRMRETTGHPAFTVHKMLMPEVEHVEGQRIETDPVFYGCVVVDESSMMDVELMARLLSRIDNTAMLLIVGDKDQLPSVGPGAVLRHLIESGAIPTTQLQTPMRQDKNSLINWHAHDINAGDVPAFEHSHPRIPAPPLLRKFHTSSMERLETAVRRAESAEVPDRALVEECESLLDKVTGIEERWNLDGPTPDCLFIEVDDPDRAAAQAVGFVADMVAAYEEAGEAGHRAVQLLAPMRKGAFGVAAMNAALQSRLNPPREGEPSLKIDQETTFRVGDKVLHTKNNYGLGVMNGEVGVVRAADAENQSLIVEYDREGGPEQVTYASAALYELTLAYAMTVHKSQGSEYKAVVIALHDQHYVMLQRNLLYTALTRAKELAVLVGTRKALERAVRNNQIEQRYSRLKDRLVEATDGQRRQGDAEPGGDGRIDDHCVRDGVVELGQAQG